MLYFALFRCVTSYLFYFCSWPGQNITLFVLCYRRVKHIQFNRTYPVSSLSFFFLPCLAIFALNDVSVPFDISNKNGFWTKTTPVMERSGSFSEIHVQYNTIQIQIIVFSITEPFRVEQLTNNLIQWLWIDYIDWKMTTFFVFFFVLCETITNQNLIIPLT